MSNAVCGKRALFPLITQILCMSLGLVAFAMSSSAVSGCSYIAPSGGVDNDGDPRVCYEQWGPFASKVSTRRNGVCIYSQCVKLKIVEGGYGSIKPAQAFGAIAALIGGIVWLSCLFMLFFRFPAWLYKTIGGLFIFCFFSQMLTLLMLNLPACSGDLADLRKLNDEGYTCNLGSDAVTAIIAAIFYLGLGVTVLICPPPKTQVIDCVDFKKCCKDGCSENGEEECGCCGGAGTMNAVENGATSTAQRRAINSGAAAASNSTVTETYNEDGTITIKEESINADGSKTISITTKPNPAAVCSSV